jgi:soluble lytic murein transglycosylase
MLKKYNLEKMMKSWQEMMKNSNEIMKILLFGGIKVAMVYIKFKKKMKIFLLLAMIPFTIFIIYGATIVMLPYFRFFTHLELINYYSNKRSLDPTFVSALIHTESKFDKNAVSHRGASGLMQIMEDTAYWVAEINNIENFKYEDIFDPATNINIGTLYLSKLMDNHSGNKQFVMIAYNAGSGNLNRWRNDENFSQDGGMTISYIPFRETRDYVKRVERRQTKYRYIFRIFRL